MRVHTIACHTDIGRSADRHSHSQLRVTQSVSHAQYLRRSHEVVTVIRETFTYARTNDRRSHSERSERVTYMYTIAHTVAIWLWCSDRCFPFSRKRWPSLPEGKEVCILNTSPVALSPIALLYPCPPRSMPGSRVFGARYHFPVLRHSL